MVVERAVKVQLKLRRRRHQIIDADRGSEVTAGEEEVTGGDLEPSVEPSNIDIRLEESHYEARH